MTYFNAVKYFKSAAVTSNEGALEAVLARLSNPQRRIKYIRLAGSNGKTVSAEMLCAVMSCANYTLGSLRMPLRDDPRENVCIGREPLSMEEFATHTATVRAAAAAAMKEGAAELTGAEILLCVALLAFVEARCELCLIESDHFGSDPSITLPPPFAAVICGSVPINDSREISRIRSYICRGIQEIVSVPQNSEAYRIISETCYSINCRLTLPSRNAIEIGRLSFRGTEFSYKGKAYSLRLCGRFQVYNAVLVLEIIEMLLRKGFDISDSAVYEGFSRLSIPAKFEVVSINPLIIVDSTHTPVAIETVCDALADFEQTAQRRVRLCLPERSLIEAYVQALRHRGYKISSVVSPSNDCDGCEDVTFFVGKTPKALAKTSLNDLPREDILIISGDYPFVNAVRYELLSIMGF